MISSARCWRPRRGALAIATSLLSGCATDGSNPPIATVCPPVVEHSREFQARAAKEVVLLPDESAIAEMLADYGVMRDQTHVQVARALEGIAAPRLLNGVTEIRGSLGEISDTQVLLTTAIWLQTMVPLTAGDSVELQGYFRIADGYFAADNTSFWGCKIG